MRKFYFYLLVFCFAVNKHTTAQTQSVIYDAVMLMNAKYGVNGLVIPTSNSRIIVDPLTNKVTDMGDDSAQPPATFRTTSLSKDIIIAILKRNAGLLQNATIAEVKEAYKANPFLKNAVDDSYPKDNLALTDNVKKISTSNLSGGIGNNLLGNLVNGTADFLIKRAQEEISISVFEKLKNILSRYPELDTLFPRTCALIKPVEPYEYNKALQAFKDAIHEDLKDFVPRISLLYSIPRYNILNKRVPSLTLIFTGSALLGELHDKSGFAESVYQLGERSFLDEKNSYASLVKALTIISNSITDKKLTDAEDIPHHYIDKDFIKAATHDDAGLYKDLSAIYLGLLWQHTHTLMFTTSNGTKNLGEMLERWLSEPDISKAIKTIDIVLNTIVTVDQNLENIKEADDDNSRATGKSTASTKRFASYATLVSQLLNLSDLYIVPGNTNFNTRIKEIREYLPAFTSQVTTIIKDFQQEEYNLGISDFSALLKTASDYLDEVEKDKRLSNMLTSDFKIKLDNIKANLDYQKGTLEARINNLPASGSDAAVNTAIEMEKQELIAQKNKILSALDNIKYQDDNKKSSVYKLSKIIEYVNLLASITKAENSAAVETLLETYSLPAGSSRIKKVAAFNIAVNAYVGGFFARPKKEGDGFTNTYGLSAPIGFTISTGFQKAGSLSLFAGVFDIGGTIRYKLDNQGKYQQDISLAGIVSPSLHVVYGFPWYLPLSFGLGYQWVSPVSTTSSKIDLKPKFNAFIAVDIPLFNLNVVKHK